MDDLLMNIDVNENVIIHNDADNYYSNCISHADVAFAMKRLIIQSRCSLSDNCAICLENIHNSKCIYLPCKHAFHFTCLQQLIKRKIYICPLCRGDFKQTLTVLGLFNVNSSANNANANANANDNDNDNDNEEIEMTFYIENEFVDMLLEWLRQNHEVNFEMLE